MKTLWLTAATLPLLVSPAFAQAEDAPKRQETVIVTAPGLARSADELIGNATALERDEIVDVLASTLGDTLDAQPGVATTFFGQGASRPILRGLGAERVLVLTNGIGVIDASAASPDHQVSADGIDAEKIEILRGPSALAYGGQAIGGVVNVIDGLIVESKPDAPFEAHGFTAYNSVNDGTELGGHVQIANGPFALNLSASSRDFDDYDIPGFAESSRLRALEEAEEEDHDEEEHDHEEEEETRGTVENTFAKTSTLAGGFSWIGETGFLGIALRQQTAEYGLPGGHAHEEGEHDHDEDDHDEEEHDHEEHEAHEEESPFIDLEQTRIDIRGGADLNMGILTSLSGALAIIDYKHTEFEAPGEPGTIYETDGVEGRIELGHSVYGLDGSAGVQYIDKELAAFGDEAFITPTTSESLGVFLYEAREWDNGAGIEGGLRYDTVTLDNINAGEREFDLLSGSLGVHHHWESGLFLGTQVSLTERAPNESELFADGAHLATSQYEVGNANFGKETGLNIEATARWTTDTLSIGASLFHTDFDDFIYLTPGSIVEDGIIQTEEDGLPVFQFVQRDATFKGGEIYGDILFADGAFGADWTLNASLDYVDADVSGGGDVPLVPPLTLNAGITADWQAWRVGADITLAAKQSDAGVGQLKTSSYQQLNLRLERDVADLLNASDGTKVFIEARNVTDEEIRYATSVLRDVAPAPGRNIRVGFRAAF